ncbi:sulfite exporter TauE/SafE family protein [Hahella sp. KA22]|uniref:sulfite exporter TauE/SafE family protein n=1 Tax=Hahella sp. KA22 TaxID=1628392 RepID=UPI000FDE76F4|nr:sulfite exporter TauE/SafE family protein [Hahella sp. KA22]AZZ95048.1 sulfite exporter TauE/SafE family protein [Hahella sp. KA22]QAY52693.1 sulfite exporter TauE/SafE family protein [Hahella sp. KA22]
MAFIDWSLIFVILAGAAAIQTWVGFGFGLVFLGGCTLLGLSDLKTLTLAISLLSLTNTSTALKGMTHHVQWRALFWCLSAAVPGIAAGVWLLEHAQAYSAYIQLTLGIALAVSSLFIAFKPHASPQPSHNATFAATGALAGVMGGLFSTFGPPAAFLMFRQPLSLDAIRSTLQAMFFTSSILRVTLALTLQSISPESWWLWLAGLPVVWLSTLAAKRYHLPLADAQLRRMVFIGLLLIGVSITLSSLKTIAL